MEQKSRKKRISIKTGFTTGEIGVILFLLVTGTGGLLLKLFSWEELKIKQFDYSYTDSLFYSAAGGNISDTNLMYTDKKVDYKQEVLDFNEANLVQKSTVTPAEKSIDLNAATLEDLTMLPGIGIKTAEKIVSLRAERKRFRSVKELLDVKGIGEAKLFKIEPYLFIDR